LLFRKSQQINDHDDEALQDILGRTKKNSNAADAKFTGEVCLLLDSPFRIIRVRYNFDYCSC